MREVKIQKWEDTDFSKYVFFIQVSMKNIVAMIAYAFKIWHSKHSSWLIRLIKQAYKTTLFRFIITWLIIYIYIYIILLYYYYIVLLFYII